MHFDKVSRLLFLFYFPVLFPCSLLCFACMVHYVGMCFCRNKIYGLWLSVLTKSNKWSFYSLLANECLPSRSRPSFSLRPGHRTLSELTAFPSCQQQIASCITPVKENVQSMIGLMVGNISKLRPSSGARTGVRSRGGAVPTLAPTPTPGF